MQYFVQGGPSAKNSTLLTVPIQTVERTFRPYARLSTSGIDEGVHGVHDSMTRLRQSDVGLGLSCNISSKEAHLPYSLAALVDRAHPNGGENIPTLCQAIYIGN
jgi:hypothetical protein